MFQKGMIVEFGRRNGEKTRARVLRVNKRTLTVETVETRGTRKTHPVGSKWRVHPALVKIVTD